MFLSSDNPRKLGTVSAAAGWAEVAEKLDVFEVPGNHREMFNEPHVEVLARGLRKYLDEEVALLEPDRLGTLCSRIGEFSLTVHENG